MSAFYLVGLLALLLGVVGYLMFTNAQQKRREQQQRLLTALKARRNLFKELLTRFPSGFLPKEIATLLHRSVRDTAEQLTQLEPRNSDHQEDVVSASTQLTQLLKSNQQPRVRLTNTEQIQEARKLLQELFRFITLQEQTHHLSPQDAHLYKDLIKRLALQITVDGHVLNAKAGLSAGKPRLAIHFYSLALKLLTSENAGKIFDKQILQLTQHIAKLEAGLGNRTPTPDDPSADWEKFEKESTEWKKKNLYD